MRLIDLVREKTPKFNPDIARGYASKEMAEGEDYVKAVLKAASASLPEEIEYVGPGTITTKEALEILMGENRGGKNGNRQSYEYARSNIYLMKCLFRYKGELVAPQYIGLPFVTDGALMKITGSTYSVAPQLADIAVSVTSSEIFVPVTRDKLKYHRNTHPIRFNGMTTIGNVVWSNLYRDSKRDTSNMNKTVVMNTAVVHYLLAKFGLTETARRMGVGDYIVGDSDEERVKYMSQGYLVYESSRQPPRGLKQQTDPTKLWFAFHPDQHKDSISRDFIASFYYIVDHFPDRITINELDNPVRWLVLLAHAVFANGEKETKLLELVRNHINSIEHYVDAKSREWFELDGIGHVEDIYDLMVEIANSYTRRRLDAAKTSTSMYNKYLLVNRKVYSDIVSGIFKCIYKLQQKVRSRGDQFSRTELETELKNHLNSRRILRLNQAVHPEVEPVSCPGAYMAYKVTTRLVLQSNVTNSSKAAKTIFDPFTMGNDVSIAECGMMLAPTKGEATGRGQFNLFTKVEARTGKILQKEHLRHITDPTQELLKQT